MNISLAVPKPFLTASESAFTVAWVNISAQLSRLVALIVLLKELKAAGISSIQIALCWTILIRSLGMQAVQHLAYHVYHANPFLGLGFGNVAKRVRIIK